MVHLNEFFREITLRLCGHLEIEEGLNACIKYLSNHLPADYIYMEKYEEDFGAMRYIARANSEKGERMSVLVPMSTEAKTQAAGDREDIYDISKSVFIINNSEEHPIAGELVKALDHPPCSILGIMLTISGDFAGAVILAAEGVGRFNQEHAKLFGALKEPFFVAMSNALKHREVLKLKDMLADDNRYLHGELRRMSGDEIVGSNFGLKQVMSRVHQVATMASPVLILGETGTGKV
jgi:transcriptional regulator with GAF, ATPase, and Fis domain